MDPIYFNINCFLNYPKNLLNEKQNKNRDFLLEFKKLVSHNKIDKINNYFEKNYSQNNYDDNLFYAIEKFVLSIYLHGDQQNILKLGIKFVKKINNNMLKYRLLYDLYNILSKYHKKYMKMYKFNDKKSYSFERQI